MSNPEYDRIDLSKAFLTRRDMASWPHDVGSVSNDNGRYLHATVIICEEVKQGEGKLWT